MSVAWTGEGEETEEFVIGEFPVYHLNPYFQDGTRLRVGPDREAAFSGEAILNDVEVEIVDLSDDGFARVRSFDANGGCTAETAANILSLENCFNTTDALRFCIDTLHPA